MVQRFIQYYVVSFVKRVRTSCDLNFSLWQSPALCLAKKWVIIQSHGPSCALRAPRGSNQGSRHVLEIVFISSSQLTLVPTGLRAGGIVVGRFLRLIVHMDETSSLPTSKEPFVCMMMRG